jgi:hypothetical protein
MVSTQRYSSREKTHVLCRNTTNHESIRKWPNPETSACHGIGDPRKGDAGILRIDFDSPRKGLEPISWRSSSKKFDEAVWPSSIRKDPPGLQERFFKLVRRESKSHRRLEIGGAGRQVLDEGFVLGGSVASSRCANSADGRRVTARARRRRAS